MAVNQGKTFNEISAPLRTIAGASCREREKKKQRGGEGVSSFLHYSEAESFSVIYCFFTANLKNVKRCSTRQAVFENADEAVSIKG